MKATDIKKHCVKTLFCVYICGCVCTLLFVPQLHVHGKIATEIEEGGGLRSHF